MNNKNNNKFKYTQITSTAHSFSLQEESNQREKKMFTMVGLGNARATHAVVSFCRQRAVPEVELISML